MSKKNDDTLQVEKLSPAHGYLILKCDRRPLRTSEFEQFRDLAQKLNFAYIEANVDDTWF